MAVNLFVVLPCPKFFEALRSVEGKLVGGIEEKRGRTKKASPRNQLSFHAGFRLSKKALSPSIASLVFIKRSR